MESNDRKKLESAFVPTDGALRPLRRAILAALHEIDVLAELCNEAYRTIGEIAVGEAPEEETSMMRDLRQAYERVRSAKLKCMDGTITAHSGSRP